MVFAEYGTHTVGVVERESCRMRELQSVRVGLCKSRNVWELV